MKRIVSILLTILTIATLFTGCRIKKAKATLSNKERSVEKTSASSSVPTAPNGYDYSYFVPQYDGMLKEAHKYKNVFDFADILTDEEEADLQARAKQRSKQGYNVYFLTYDNACGKDTRTFTDDFYDYYITNITKLDFDNQVTGILYAIDMDNRELYINTAGALADSLSSDDAYSILDKTFSYASDEEYCTCFLKTDDLTLDSIDPTL